MSYEGSLFGLQAVDVAAISEVGAAELADHSVVVAPRQAALHLPDQVMRSVFARTAAAAVGVPVAGARFHPREP